LNYAHARAINEPDGQTFTLAPEWTSTGGLSLKIGKDLMQDSDTAILQIVQTNEDNNMVAEGYFVSDLNT
jgi:hypothetical protein